MLKLFYKSHRFLRKYFFEEKKYFFTTNHWCVPTSFPATHYANLLP